MVQKINPFIKSDPAFPLTGSTAFVFSFLSEIYCTGYDEIKCMIFVGRRGRSTETGDSTVLDRRLEVMQYSSVIYLKLYLYKHCLMPCTLCCLKQRCVCVNACKEMKIWT